jgi:putative oxidoreductase
MGSWLARYQDRAYAILRMVSGLLLAWDGASALLFDVILNNMFRDHPVLPPFASLVIPIRIVQLVAGLAIAVGFRASLAALAASAAVAGLWLGWLSVTWFALLSLLGFESVRAVSACAGWFLQFFLYLFIATRGPGIWSLDHLRKKSGTNRLTG